MQRLTEKISAHKEWIERRTLTFLGAREQTTVLLKRKVDVNEIRTCQKLHDHARCDDGAYPKFHEGAPVGGKDDTHSIEL